MGPVSLSNMTKKPVVPVAWAVDRFWRAPGWDGMIIPKPFSRGIMVWGTPIAAPQTDNSKSRDKDHMESQRRALEAAINQVTDEADQYFAPPDKGSGNA